MKLKQVAIAVVALGAIIASGIAIHAQDASTTTTPAPATTQGGPGGGYGGHRGGGMAKMAEALGLTDAQKAKIKPIQDSMRTQMMSLHDNTTLTDDQKRTQMMAIRKSSMDQINAILTPAQQAKLKTLEAQMRARWQQRQQDQSGSDAAPAQGSGQ